MTRGGPALKDGAFPKLSIANPKSAPYGAAAIETMKALGVYDSLKPKIVEATSIARAFEFVDTGNAEAGFAALSQLHGVKDGTRWIVPANLYAPIGRADSGLHLHRPRHRLGRVQPALRGPADPQRLQAIGDRPLEAAAALRASPWRAFWAVALPLASPGLLSGGGARLRPHHRRTRRGADFQRKVFREAEAMDPDAIRVRIRGVFGKFALDAAFDAPAQGVTALFGRSGCGRTMILRSIGGDIWQNAKSFLPAHRRPPGYVFRRRAIFRIFRGEKSAVRRAEGPAVQTPCVKSVSLAAGRAEGAKN